MQTYILQTYWKKMLNETHQIDNNGRDSEVQSKGWLSQMISGLSDY